MGESHSKTQVGKEHINYLKGMDYKVLSFLGEGRCGKVVRAKHLHTNEIVAIKISEFNNYDGAKEDAEKELAMLKKVGHVTNVVKLIGHSKTSKALYLILENCSGGDLEGMLEKKKKKLDPSTALGLFEQMIEGVHELHELGIIHRDLKPLNILLTEQKEVRIIDFGLSNNGSLFYSISGTREFSAPEYYKAAETAKNSSTDIWALGCIFYMMVSGRRPFSELKEDKKSYISSSKLKKAELNFSGMKLEDDLKEIIQACVQKLPKDRIDSSSLLKVSLYLI